MAWGSVSTQLRAFAIGSDPARVAEARAAATAAGMAVETGAIVDAVPHDALALVEFDSESMPLLQWLLARGGPAIVAFPPDCLDQMAPLLDTANVQLLCDPGPADRITAIAVARGTAGAVAEIDIPREAIRLQQLADEVGRIAAALSAQPGLPRFAHGSISTASSRIDVADIRTVLRLRRKRDLLFGGGIFADPAWDMLLDLTAARLDGAQVPVSSLCLAAAVPSTTALRWMRTLFALGLIERRSDVEDKRRIHIALTDSAFAAMSDLLGEAKRSGVALI